MTFFNNNKYSYLLWKKMKKKKNSEKKLKYQRIEKKHFKIYEQIYSKLNKFTKHSEKQDFFYIFKIYFPVIKIPYFIINLYLFIIIHF